MIITAHEVERYWLWLDIVTECLFPTAAQLPSEARPRAAYNRVAATSPAKARSGLAMAIGDMVEMSSSLSSDEAAALNRRLRDASLPDLATMQRRFNRKVARILKRGSINSEPEYHAIANALDGADDAERKNLEALIGAYEMRQS